jgi:hypothetical protein
VAMPSPHSSQKLVWTPMLQMSLKLQVGSLDPSSQTLVSSIGVPNGRCFYMFNWTSEVPSVF